MTVRFQAPLRLAKQSEADIGDESAVQSASAIPIVEQPKSAIATPDPAQAHVTAFVPVEREALEAAVKEATAPQQLEHLLMQYSPAQLSLPELVLFCNQLGKVTNASSMTVRAWSQTQVPPIQAECSDCMHGRCV